MQNPSQTADGGTSESAPAGSFTHAPCQAGGYPAAQPGGYMLVQPGGYQPAQLGGYQPAQPGGYQPAQPGGYQPAQPGGYQPVQPGGYQPAQPGGYPPAQPGGYLVKQPMSYPAGQPGGYPNPNQYVGYQPQGYVMAPGMNLPTGGYISAPAVQYQGQGQAPMLIVQTTAAVEWPTRQKYLPKMHIIVLGIIQILCGVASIVLNGAGLGIDSYLNFIGHGFWCGIPAVIAGSLGVGAGFRQGKFLLIWNMVMSIIAAVFIYNQIGFAISSIAVDSSDKACLVYKRVNPEVQFSYTGYGYDGYCSVSNRFSTTYSISGNILGQVQWRKYDASSSTMSYSEAISQLNSCIAVDVLLLLFGLTELVISIWSSALGCRFVCCGCCRSCCCTCYKAIDPQTRTDVLTRHTHQIVFQNGQQMAPQGAGNVMMQPYPAGALIGQAMMSPPPYSGVMSASGGDSTSEQLTDTKQKDGNVYQSLINEPGSV